MSLKASLNSALKDSMKAKDQMRTSVLRMILSEVKYAQSAVNIHQELSENDILKVVTSYHKRLQKSLDDYPEGERKEAIRKEIAIIEEYLPKKASEAEIRAMIVEAINESQDRNFGVLMKVVMSKLGSSADGKLVSTLLKDKLSNN